MGGFTSEAQSRQTETAVPSCQPTERPTRQLPPVTLIELSEGFVVVRVILRQQLSVGQLDPLVLLSHGTLRHGQDLHGIRAVCTTDGYRRDTATENHNALTNGDETAVMRETLPFAASTRPGLTWVPRLQISLGSVAA